MSVRKSSGLGKLTVWILLVLGLGAVLYFLAGMDTTTPSEEVRKELKLNVERY